MKNLLFIGTFVLSANLIAQPAFTSADMPNIGDNDTVLYINYHAISNNLDTETGNGYAWDFSSLPFTPSFFEVDSFRVKTHPVSAPHTNATIEEYREGSSGQYVSLFSFSNDTLYQYRTGTVSSGTSFNPPLASIKFPINFNQTSDITAPIYSGTNIVGERRTTTLYDGFGTLKMPGSKNYNNVFRIKKVETDTNFVTNYVTTYTNYIWYKQGGSIPLLRLLYTGASNLYFVYGSKAANISTSIENMNSKNNVQIYPNPTNDILNISSNGKITSLKIFSLSGKLLMTESNNNQASVAKLQNGFYFIEIKTSKGQISLLKFIKN